MWEEIRWTVGMCVWHMVTGKKAMQAWCEIKNRKWKKKKKQPTQWFNLAVLICQKATSLTRAVLNHDSDIIRTCVCCRIPAYVTVDVVITHPAAGDAWRVSALELAGATGRLSTFHLVRAVAAFVLAVAHKVLRDAAAAGTCKLICGTGDVT